MPEKNRALYRAKDGGFIPGVPARHLTQADYDALGDDERAAVRDSGLYEVRSDEEMQGGTAGASAPDAGAGAGADAAAPAVSGEGA